VDTTGGGMEVADAGRSGFWVTGMLGFSIRLLGAFPVHAGGARDLVCGAGDLATGIGSDRRANGRGSGSPDGFFHGECPHRHRIPAAIILVPVAFLTGIPAEHVIALLTHEWRIFAGTITSPHSAKHCRSCVVLSPAVWWISGQIRTERELCCDDMAIACGADALTYAARSRS